MINIPHNIYIHVPFCVSKCNYCAFFSHECATPDWDKYATDIIREIEHWGQTLGRISVPTIFFGGGTPSLMPIATFDRIITALHTNFYVANDTEITLESNPGTLDDIKLAEFISAGTNRLSVGVQSFDDTRLQFLGRRHNATQARHLLDVATAHNIRVSADFIYGAPGDTVDYVKTTCSQINDIGLSHCSMYELTIEPTTPFGKRDLQMPTNDEMADMYCAISETLALPRYEVSNYARPGDECRHNQNVWDGAPYIGIGRGAAGRIFLDNVWYEQSGANMCFNAISDTVRATEKVLTGMRTIRGVALFPDIKNVIDMNFVANNPDLLQISDDGARLRATNKGLLILDDLMINLVK